MAAAACSSGDDSAGGTGDAAATSGDETPISRACDQGAAQDRVEAAPVAGTPRDRTITSFDGTRIRAHWFPAPAASTGDPAPTVLMGPGWSLPGATLATDAGDGGTNPVSSGALGIATLNDAGYNVLTWDPRGFGASTGTVTVNDPDYEGHDVQVLLDWVATQPGVRLDTEGDPRAGMVGASYGGGIQLIVAGIDCRVDALVPNVAWHSLETSLFRNETVKAGWAGLLNTAASGAARDPHLVEAADTGLTTGVLDDETIEWFRDRGPGDLVDQVTAPTLLVHGTVDTLFTPGEAVTNFTALRSAGTPVAMLWYCGGHGACLTDPGDPALVTERTLAWLDHYLGGDAEADTGPVVDIVDQDGRRWVGDDFPDGADDPLTAEGDGETLALTAESVAGPITPAGSDDMLAGLVAGFTPGRADRAVELTLEADHDALVLGAPRVTLTYRGTTPDGPEPTRAFAQIVDDESGHVLGNQITPVPITLDGDEHTTQVDLEVVAHHVVEGARVTLQLVATTPAYATPRLGGKLTVTDVALELPTTDDLSPPSND
ncbi:MAG TPA: CocE/NonD family hydrolase [Acidimicrobiales bacterium]|nr:CocE/NonD family hydrolase [Acidimicrobiales bacterium]